MITDHARLKVLLEDWEVPYSDDPGETPGRGSAVTVTAQSGGPAGTVMGYSGFFVEFRFDRDGKFKDMGVWE